MAIELNHTIVPARGVYFRDPDGHLMEILTPAEGEPT